MKIVLSTRSMHPELTEKAQSLWDSCDFIDEYRQLKLRSDWEYLDDCIYNTDADLTISIDEDFFLIRPDVMEKIVEYIIENDIEMVGPRTTTTDAPIIDNWFHISNNKLLKKCMPSVQDRVLLRVYSTPEYYKDVEFNDCFHGYDKHEFFFLLMVDRGCKFEFFSKNAVDFEILKTRGIDFGFHTRQGRDYNKKDIKKHIDEVYDFVRSKYYEKHLNSS